MMMKMMKLGAVAIVAGTCVLSGALPAESAAAPVAPAKSNEIHIVNAYRAPVDVYLEDAAHRLHYLGRVLSADAKTLTVDEEVVAKGGFRIKVYPESVPLGSMADADGIRTRDIVLQDGDVLRLFVERNLSRSGTLVTSG